MRRPPEADERNAFYAGGRLVRLAAPVLTWQQTGLLFTRASKPRPRTDLIVVHWTGSENRPEDVHHNMTRRGVSVHFVLEPRGVVYQMCDADRIAAHAEGVNARAVGIEVVCRGDDEEVPEKGVVRAMYTERIHGRPCVYAGFTSAQELSLVVLVTALCTVFDVPVRVPVGPDGDVLPRVLSKAELAGFRGVVGHLHLSAMKRDPGIRALQIFGGRRVA